MASTSGTVVTSPEQKQRSLTLTWSQTSQSIPNNTTTISWTLKGSGSDSIYYYVTCRRIKVTINGTQAWYHAGEIDVNNQEVIATGTFDVPHNADGTKTFTIAVEAAIYEVAVNSTGSGSWTLATIPRYASVSQSVSSKTETTITMAWSSDSTVDYIWYKIGSGSWNGIDVADGKSGTYTITGRSANTAYMIYTRVRRKDSQLTTDSSGLSVTTYSYPYASSMPNFNIGNDVTITVYNPLSRSITLRMKGADNSTIASKTLSGTSVKGFNTTAIQTALYASIPNSASGTYKIECVYASQTQTRTGGTYTALAANCKPSIASASYVDENASTVAITGDASKIVRTLSQVTFTGSSCAAQKSASVSSVSVSVNGSTYAMTLSGETATKTGVTINSGTNVTAVITVTDSRGFTASASVTVTMINWQLPTGIISLKRHDNYYSETDIKCDATWTSVGSNTCTITYQCRVQGTESWTITGTLADNVTSEITLDNQYAWDVWIVLTDSFGGTTTYKLQLSRGMPIAFFDRLRNSMGLNCFPSADNALDVNGNALLVEEDRIGIGGAASAANLLELASNWKLNPRGGIIGYKNVFHNEARLTTAGWYTVLVFNAQTDGQRRFSYSCVIDFNITRVYSYDNNETYHVKFLGSYNNLQFIEEDGVVNVQCIDGIRYTHDGNTGYFQIHYNGSRPNDVIVDCVVYGANTILPLFSVGNLASGSGTSVVESTLSVLASVDTSPNYVKFGNGLMVQWGETSQQCTLSQIASSGIYYGYYDVSFPAAFLNNYYVVSGVSQYSTGHIVPIGFASRSTTSFRPHIYDFYPRSGQIRVAWQAIGRWK